MPKLSLAGFRDPSRKARYIIWTGVTGLLLLTFLIVALGITSTRWFCANGCHKVQDDTIIAYQHSAHANISCMACHMPVDSGPITFMLHKVEALGELYLTVSGTYELPLNAESEVAAEMPAEQCTQCHNMRNRVVTPSKGILIDHEIHMKNKVNCTACHNRTAHLEDFEMTLKDPRSGEPNEKHEDYMKMEACFRCHGLEKGSRAPGKCLTCHPKNFEFKPENHLQPNFYSATGSSEGHWKLKEQRPEYCRTCHDEKDFCTGCHGVQMPHPNDFEKQHGDMMKKRNADTKACVRCHRSKAGGTVFCNSCHHKGSNADAPWLDQHYVVVKKNGAAACFQCHEPTYCARCHVRSIK